MKVGRNFGRSFEARKSNHRFGSRFKPDGMKETNLKLEQRKQRSDLFSIEKGTGFAGDKGTGKRNLFEKFSIKKLIGGDCSIFKKWAKNLGKKSLVLVSS